MKNPIFILVLLFVSSVISAQLPVVLPKNLEHSVVLDTRPVNQYVDQQAEQDPYDAVDLIRRAKLRKLLGEFQLADQDAQLASRMNPYVLDLYGYEEPYSVIRVMAYAPKSNYMELDEYEKLTYFYEELDEQLRDELISHKEWTRKVEILRLMDAGEWSSAEQANLENIKENPNSGFAHLLHAKILLEAGDYAQSQNYLKEAQDLSDNPLQLYLQSQLEFQQGAVSSAIKSMDKVIQKDENLMKAWFARAIFKKIAGDYRGAAEDYTYLIKNSSSMSDEAYYNRGLCYKLQGKYELALQDFDQAAVYFPEKAVLFKNRGNTLLILNKPKEAIADYTRAYELDGNYSEALFNRALAHFLLYDFENGCKDMHRSYDMGYQRAKDQLGYFCNRNSH